MTLDEIQKEIDKLQAIKRELEQQEQERYNAKAAQFVGKCYRFDNGQVCKILSIPQRTYEADFHYHYRKHCFPALFLQYVLPFDEDDNFSPCYLDEIYFDIQFEKPLHSTEITKEEFDAEFDKRIVYFKEQINV